MPRCRSTRFAPSSRRIAALMAGLILGMLGFLPLAGCQKDSPQGKSFRFPLEAEPRQLDPQVADDAASTAVIAALFEGLTRLDETGKAVPAAAEWTVSSDGKTYTFSLKESYWSTLEETDWENPTPVRAQDFVYGMRRAVQPQTGSSLASQLFGIVGAREIHEGKQSADQLGVRAADDRTLIITLTEADPSFPERLAGTAFMPCNESFFQYTGGRYGLEEEYLLTNGPFSLAAWNHDESLLLYKHEDYHDASEVYPAAVRYVIGSENTDPGQELLNGRLDAAELSADKLPAAREAGFSITTARDTTRYLWMNNTCELLSVPETRRALRDALEWTTLYAQLNAGTSSPAAGYVPPDAQLTGGELYRTDQNRRAFSTKVSTAQQEWATGLRKLELTSAPHLKVLCADDEASTNFARYIIQSWQKNLTVYFELTPLPASSLQSRIQVGNYQLAIAPSTGTSLTALGHLAAFTSDSSTGNYARYKSDRYDSLYENAQAGGATRQEIDQLEQQLMTDCPCVPLAFEQRFFGLNPLTSGIQIRPFGGGDYGAPYDFRQAGKLDE